MRPGHQHAEEWQRHISPAGELHFGISVNGPDFDDASSVSGWYQGKINGPDFNRGAGTRRDLTTVQALP